ncbi:LysE family translocator [Pseudomonas sp. No.21]|uniref:LysE family translocator n=1 Tax=Pseudomonas TaxID=286 RepID=UPI000DA950C1|nr:MULTISPECIES: LysE family transporter [Pseudomonas]MDW3711311.1 LysE family transporter [Pseudomonas sp. 2023EL-01195]PZE11375.1 LysE family translocator [Pseudomonas sp. 57B-090624]GJN49295.1 lysine transporter LysE [Pseudomonas tohonis]
MPDLDTFVLFTCAVALLLVSPGPNMAFVISHGVSHGWRGGVAAALGISLADAILTLLTAAGITGLVAAWPPSFDIIRFAGALYLAWMAWKILCSSAAAGGSAVEWVALRTVLVRATLNSLLNPKALLFFIVFLPQFVVPERGPISAQLLLLGALLTLLAFLFHVGLGLFGGSLGRRLGGRGRFANLQKWGLASLFGALALRLVVMQRPA